MKRFRWLSLLVFISLAGAIAAIACTEGDKTPTPSKAPTATTAPTVAPQSTGTATQAPTPAATTPMSAPVPPATPQPTPLILLPPEGLEQIAKPVPLPASAPLVAAAAERAFSPFGFSDGSLVSFAQQLSMAGGLTISASGSVTVAADQVYVSVIPEQFYGSRGPQPLSSEARAAVIKELAAIGIKEDDIEIKSVRPYEPQTVSVKVKAESLPDIGERVIDAVEDALRRRSQSRGVRLGVSKENCDKALALARRQAIPGVEASARDLSEVLGVRLGGIKGAIEYPPSGFEYGQLISDRCGSGQPYDPYTLLPLDTKPEVEVSVRLLVTYDIVE